ncbi:hypothetical protein GN958_ATG16290 [Phytophthora infestans]|uniref:Uncharacterized protein n=1 Tax=Phytophthora infestans TaxID=4787 RepID=A0A8S9U4C3_PHYIN|nr:hypothetical protein GN958_ATG16290 [Phytophthora infestans]
MPKPSKPFSSRGSIKITTNKKAAIVASVLPKAKQKLTVRFKQGVQRQVTKGPPPKGAFIVVERKGLLTARQRRKRTKKPLEQGDVQSSKHGGKPTACKESTTRLCRIRKCLPPEGGTVQLEGVCSAPFCANSGATRTSLGDRGFRRLMVVECPSVN